MDKTEKKLIIAMGLATAAMWITIIRLLVEILGGGDRQCLTQEKR